MQASVYMARAQVAAVYTHVVFLATLLRNARGVTPRSGAPDAPSLLRGRWYCDAAWRWRYVTILVRVSTLCLVATLCALVYALVVASRGRLLFEQARALTVSDPILLLLEPATRARAPLPRSTVYPSAECTQVHFSGDTAPRAGASWRADALVRSLAIYARTDGVAVAAHTGEMHCVAMLCLEPTYAGAEPRLLFMVNPVVLGHSEATHTSIERDSLCRIDRMVKFRRYVSLSVRYSDSLGRTHVRHLGGDDAARAQHALDILGAFSVCADDSY